MQGWFQQGWATLAATALCVGMAGCAAQHEDSLRLSEELGRARADAAWQQARATALESRLSRLEQRAAAELGPQRAEDRQLLDRLARLLDTNERLLAERSVAPVPTGSATLAPSPEQQLRELVESMRGRSGGPHGRLSREQEGALRVLTQPIRQLDAENPWPAAFY